MCVENQAITIDKTACCMICSLGQSLRFTPVQIVTLVKSFISLTKDNNSHADEA